MKTLGILRELPKCDRQTQSEQMLLEKWCQQTCSEYSYHKLICKKKKKKKNHSNLWIAIKQSWRNPGVLYLSTETGHVEASGIDQGLNTCPLHWPTDFQPQDHEVLVFKYTPGHRFSAFWLRSSVNICQGTQRAIGNFRSSLVYIHVSGRIVS